MGYAGMVSFEMGKVLQRGGKICERSSRGEQRFRDILITVESIYDKLPEISISRLRRLYLGFY